MKEGFNHIEASPNQNDKKIKLKKKLGSKLGKKSLYMKE